MKLTFGVVRDGRIIHEGGPSYVSRQTAAAHEKPMMALFWREQGDGFTSGTVFLFQFPPQAQKFERELKTGVTQTRHGYVVFQQGLAAPQFRIQGHFGWRLRTVELPSYFFPVGFKSNAIIDQNINDVRLNLPFSRERGQASTLEKVLRGKVSTVGFKQTLDGQQAWQRLADFVTAYAEENVARLAEGRKPLEMVWVDPLHTLRWVVAPKNVPSLDRTVDRQGTFPYTLDLIGVYDDARPRPQKGDAVWG